MWAEAPHVIQQTVARGRGWPAGTRVQLAASPAGCRSTRTCRRRGCTGSI